MISRGFFVFCLCFGLGLMAFLVGCGSEITNTDAIPKVTNVRVAGSSDDITITYDLEDSDNSSCRIEVQWRGGPFPTTWQTATVLGTTSGLAPATDLDITWRSNSDVHVDTLAASSANFYVRITPYDTLTGIPGDSAQFSVTNPAVVSLLCAGLNGDSGGSFGSSFKGTTEAQTVYDHLDKTSRFDTPNITVSLGSSATTSSVRSAIQNLATTSVAGDLIHIYISAQTTHVSGGGTDYYYLNLYETGYTDTDIAADLAGFGTGVNVLISIQAPGSGGVDVNKSMGNLVESVMSKMWANHQRPKDLSKTGLTPKGTHVAWLCSNTTGASMPVSQPVNDFTGHYLNGLYFGDSNSDGKITGWEIYSYLSGKVRATAYKYGDSVLQGLYLTPVLTMAADAYEPDSSGSPAAITFGVPQARSLHTQTDEDWVTFTLATPQQVTITTSQLGSFLADTELTLYDSGLNEVTSDQDSGTGYFSEIVQNLVASTYFVKVTAQSNWGLQMPTDGYTLTITSP